MKITRIVIYVFTADVQLSVYAGLLAITNGRGYLEHGMHERSNVHSNSSVILYRTLLVYICMYIYTRVLKYLIKIRLRFSLDHYYSLIVLQKKNSFHCFIQKNTSYTSCRCAFCVQRQNNIHTRDIRIVS